MGRPLWIAGVYLKPTLATFTCSVHARTVWYSSRVNGSPGEPLTRLEYQTVLAWTLHVNVARVGFKYTPAIHSGRPIVLFTPTSHGGWRVQALHQRVRACRRLPK